MGQLNVDIDDDLHDKVKGAAYSNGTELKEFVPVALADAIGMDVVSHPDYDETVLDRYQDSPESDGDQDDESEQVKEESES